MSKGFIKRNIILLKIIIVTIFSGNYKKYKKEIHFLVRYGLNTYPYQYTLDYKLNNEEYGEDKDGPYVMHKCRKLYFPASEKYSKNSIMKTHLLSMIEQDILSPHRYLDENENLKNAVFFDIGCQEASLPLEFVDELKHLYLFEVEKEWNKPLEKTYAPWSNKVTIVNKYVGDTNSDDEVQISEYIKNLIIQKELDPQNDRVFIKMDIEGTEELVFADLVKMMDRINMLSLAVCVYHKKDSEINIRKMLPDNYVMKTRDTYMLFNPYSRDFKYPYFRHGVARIERVREQ